eukprot:2878642-Alexandrium_andersonii.AAC.1
MLQGLGLSLRVLVLHCSLKGNHPGCPRLGKGLDWGPLGGLQHVLNPLYSVTLCGLLDILVCSGQGRPVSFV